MYAIKLGEIPLIFFLNIFHILQKHVRFPENEAQ